MKSPLRTTALAVTALAAAAYVSLSLADATGNIQPLRPIWNIQGMAQNGVERTGVRVI